jgi:hypothetical protein
MQVARRLAVILVAAATLAVPGSALASTQPAAGTFEEGPEMNYEERFADGNLIIEFTRMVTLTGTYTGIGEAEERIVIHKDGSTNVHITIEFTGLACGRLTSLDFLIVGQGQLDENFETGVIDGIYTVINGGGTGDQTVRGHGTIEGIAGVGGTYEGQAHCDLM